MEDTFQEKDQDITQCLNYFDVISVSFAVKFQEFGPL